MKCYSVNVSEIAEIDLHDIITYIANQFDAEETAQEMYDEIEKKLMSLATFPERATLVDDDRLRLLGYRKIMIKNYIVFFTIDKQNSIVNIERILYQRRNWQELL